VKEFLHAETFENQWTRGWKSVKEFLHAETFENHWTRGCKSVKRWFSSRQGQGTYIFQSVGTVAGAHPASEGLSQRVKRSGCEACVSLPSTVDFKKSHM
jgi:hypothetical protein